MNKILLVSGGIDSFVTWHYLDKPPILFVNYGQHYFDIENDAVSKLYAGASLYSVTLSGLPPLDPNKIHVPVRNLMLASLGLRFAPRIAFGGVKDEQCSDKSPASFRKMSIILTQQHDEEVTVYSPIWHFTKAEAIGDFVKKHTDIYSKEEIRKLLRDTISCYSPERCNNCQSCFRRFVALAVNGIVEEDRLPKPDILEYFVKRLSLQPYNRALDIIKAMKTIGANIVISGRDVTIDGFRGRLTEEDLSILQSNKE